VTVLCPEEICTPALDSVLQCDTSTN